MWEKLDSIAWENYYCNYGSAIDMPKYLRALLVKSKTKRNDAYDELAEAICPQKSSRSSSLHAVPFLLELIENVEIPGRHRAIEILLCIAVGCDSDYLLPGENICDMLAGKKKAVEAMNPQEQEWSARWGPLLDLQCYDAVRKGIRAFIRLLDDPDDRVANHAAYTLAWFPDDHKLSLPRLRERLANPKSKKRLPNLILATGLLEHHAGSQRTVKSKVKPYLGHSNKLMKYAAAIYLIWHDPTPEVLALIEQLSEDQRYREVYDQTPFYDGKLSSYAEDVYYRTEESASIASSATNRNGGEQMWANLDSVPWHDYGYSYGFAKDMPEILRGLLMKSKAKRKEAYLNLDEAISHQGTLYSSSLHVVPFLIELIENDKIPDRHHAISFLLSIAVPCHSDYLLGEYKYEGLAEKEEQVEAMEEKGKEMSWAHLYLQCYNSVRKCVQIFIRLLDDPDDRVANHAAYALAWFPDDQRWSLPRLRERLVAPKNKKRLPNLILSTGLLEYHADCCRTVKSKVKPYLSHSNELLQYAAAIYLMWHDPTDEVLELIQQLSEDDRFKEMYDKTPFCDGSLMHYAENLLWYLEE